MHLSIIVKTFGLTFLRMPWVRSSSSRNVFLTSPIFCFEKSYAESGLPKDLRSFSTWPTASKKAPNHPLSSLTQSCCFSRSRTLFSAPLASF